MKKDLTEIVFILDRSGSMCGLEADTVGGFNSMALKQKNGGGKALVSTVLFNDTSVVLHDRVSIDRIRPMTEYDYTVGGCTALFDAIGGAIRHIGNIHKYARREDIPDRTLFIIITDGMENSSRYFTGPEIGHMIRRQKAKYGWEFLFLGANIDAFLVAPEIGIDEDRTVNYNNDSEGIKLNYEVMSDTISAVRCGSAPSNNWKQRIDEDFTKRGTRKDRRRSMC